MVKMVNVIDGSHAGQPFTLKLYCAAVFREIIRNMVASK